MQITIREPGSAITHFVAMMMAMAAATPLLIKAALSSGALGLPAMTVFILSMILLALSNVFLSFTSDIIIIPVR